MVGGFVLQLITERRGDAPLEPVLAAAVRGGVDVIQVREKGRPASALWRSVREAQSAADGGAAVVVNDRVDVARLAEVAGVHLPSDSLPPALARRMLPSAEGWVVGVSVHSVEEARAAASAGADYVTFGHIFASDSKPGLPGRGPAALAEVVAAVEIPVLAIGGIQPDNVASVLEAGCAGVAVIRALMDAPDPERAAAGFGEAMGRVGVRPRHPLRIRWREW